MNAFHSYDDVAALVARHTTYIPEAYEGTQIVQWYNSIERQITRLLEENEAARNFVYADQLRTFLKIWRENEITGSLNRETVQLLKVAAEQLSVQSWNLANYFSNLKTQLAKLAASEEQLPRVSGEPDDKLSGGGAGGLPPLTPDFGPEKTPPGGGMPEPAGGVPPEGEEEEKEKEARPGEPPPPRATL